MRQSCFITIFLSLLCCFICNSIPKVAGTSINRALLMFDATQLSRLRNTRIHLIGDSILNQDIKRILVSSGSQNIVEKLPTNDDISSIYIVSSTCPIFVSKMTDMLPRGRTIGMIVSSSNGIVVTDAGSKTYVNDGREKSLFYKRILPVSVVSLTGSRSDFRKKLVLVIDSDVISDTKLQAGDSLKLALSEASILFNVEYISQKISHDNNKKVVLSYDSAFSIETFKQPLLTNGLNLEQKRQTVNHTNSVGDIIRSQLRLRKASNRKEVACCPGTVLACSAITAQSAINLITKSHLPLSNQNGSQIWSISNSGRNGNNLVHAFLNPNCNNIRSMHAPKAVLSAKTVYNTHQFSKWLKSTVFNLVGAGSLGCEWIWLLGRLSLDAAPGSKIPLRIIDYDRIEPENLIRQFIYDSKHVGKPKAVVAVLEAKKNFSNLQAVPIFRKLSDKKEESLGIVTVDDLVSSEIGNNRGKTMNNVIISAVDNIQTRDLLTNEIGKFQTLVDTGVHGYRGHSDVLEDGADADSGYLHSFVPFDNTKPVCSIHAVPSNYIDCLMWSWNRSSKMNKYQSLSENEKIKQIVNNSIARAILFDIKPLSYEESVVAVQLLMLQVVPTFPASSALSCGLAACDLFRLVSEVNSKKVARNYFNMQANDYVDF